MNFVKKVFAIYGCYNSLLGYTSQPSNKSILNSMFWGHTCPEDISLAFGDTLKHRT